MHAWYSEQQKQENGYTIWTDKDGKEVIATNITRTKETLSKWQDLQYVGEVEKFHKSFVKEEYNSEQPPSTPNHR